MTTDIEYGYSRETLAPSSREQFETVLASSSQCPCMNSLPSAVGKPACTLMSWIVFVRSGYTSMEITKLGNTVLWKHISATYTQRQSSSAVGKPACTLMSWIIVRTQARSRAGFFVCLFVFFCFCFCFCFVCFVCLFVCLFVLFLFFVFVCLFCFVFLKPIYTSSMKKSFSGKIVVCSD